MQSSFCRHGLGERGSNYAHLESLALDAVRLVHEDIRTTTHSNPPRCLVKGYGLEFIGIVDVNRLKECLRAAEDYQRMAGDVRLLMTRAGQGQRIQAFSHVEKLQRNFKYRKLTTTRSPSHSAVLNDWSFAGGLPGSTARIEAGESGE